MVHEIHTTNNNSHNYGEITHIFLCTDSEKEFPELKKKYDLKDDGNNMGFQYRRHNENSYIFARVDEICSDTFEQVLNVAKYVGFEMPFSKILNEIKQFDE